MQGQGGALSLGPRDLHGMHTHRLCLLSEPEPGETLGPRLQEKGWSRAKNEGCPCACHPSAK